MPFVVDASVTACWLMPDESDSIASAAFERLSSDPGLAPAHWWFETRNVFLVAERRGRITAGTFGSILAVLWKLPVTTHPDADEVGILRLARLHRLTFYDAAYLDLAKQRSLPLATLDRALITAAKAEGVPLIGIDA